MGIVEQATVDSIVDIMALKEFSDCDFYSECQGMYGFTKLRYFQYYVFLVMAYGVANRDTSPQIANFLYLRPLKTGLLPDNPAEIVDSSLMFSLSTAINSGIQKFANLFGDRVRLTRQEAAEAVEFMRQK